MSKIISMHSMGGSMAEAVSPIFSLRVGDVDPAMLSDWVAWMNRRLVRSELYVQWFETDQWTNNQEFPIEVDSRVLADRFFLEANEYLGVDE